MKQLKLTLEDIFSLPTAVIYNPDGYRPVSSVSIDSRSIRKNSLFIAVKGENFDGHDFVREAVKKGASSVIISEKKYKLFADLNIPVITVKDTVKALGDAAKLWRKKLDTKIIGITGSAGKTTTKEILAALLSEKYKVNKTTGNNNNHIGVPLTILSTNRRHDYLVLELGTNHFGEIAYTADIASPDFALITNIGNSHLEFLKNKNGVLKEKAALFNSTAGKNGVIFINNDDALLKNEMKSYGNKITFGFLNGSNIKGEIGGFNNNGQTLMNIRYGKKTITQSLPLYGEQNAKNYLASVAVALKAGMNKSEISAGTLKLKPADKRLNVKVLRNFILIDDTYNANPDSTRLALELLHKIKKYENKIAVLGDMLELGKQGVRLHKQLAAVIKKNKIDSVYLTGKLMKHLAGELKKTKTEFKYFKDRNDLKDFLSGLDIKNSVVLVKGSRGMRMEDFVKTIEPKAND